MDVDKDKYINGLVLLYTTLLKVFKMIWSPVVDESFVQSVWQITGNTHDFFQAKESFGCLTELIRGDREKDGGLEWFWG